MKDLDKWQHEAYDAPPPREERLETGCRSELLGIGAVVLGIAVVVVILFALQAAHIMKCLPMVNC